ncbi:hypothetical protein OEZ86_009456 [Tetradesmus obliquus]|nr:hypothetical protein OEZ86_009456 [Tetradesmus obliquus]
METPQQQQFSVWSTPSNRGGGTGRGYGRGRDSNDGSRGDRGGYGSDSSRGGYGSVSSRGGYSNRGRYTGGRDAPRGRHSAGQRGRFGGYGHGGKGSGRALELAGLAWDVRRPTQEQKQRLRVAGR